MTLSKPVSDFRGVALCLHLSATGQTCFRVVLWHNDRELSVTLFEALDDHDVVAEWKQWASYFHLPKFVEREAGMLEGAEKHLGGLVLGRRTRLRRRGAAVSRRRPKAPLRRKAATTYTMQKFQTRILVNVLETP